LQAGKAVYAEREAARALHLSIFRFRALWLRRLADPYLAAGLEVTRFRPSQLLMLAAWRPSSPN
jgi:hypothetical protein